VTYSPQRDKRDWSESEPHGRTPLSTTFELGLAVLCLGGKCLASVLGFEHSEVVFGFERIIPAKSIRSESTKFAFSVRSAIGAQSVSRFTITSTSSRNRSSGKTRVTNPILSASAASNLPGRK